MIKRSILAGAVALAATCALGGVSSSIAATTSLGGSISVENSSPMIEVANRNFKRRFYYNSRMHGQRYRSRHGSYRHYHGGYWYSSPWWHRSGAVIALGVAPAYGYGYGYNAYNGGGGDHVQWCYDHYRSYDARSNTFMGYDGYRHECNSPYAY